MLSKIVKVWGGAFWLGLSIKLYAMGAFMFCFYDESGNSIYSEQDLHFRAQMFPFPVVMHYNSGGDSSERPFFRIIEKFTTESVPPELETLKIFLEEQAIDLEQIQCFEAWCIPLHPEMNYFTHPWAMDKMVENRVVSVASGMFFPVNLSPINGEIGVGTIVAQNMNFHDKDYLSGNCARFKMDDFSKPATAWFVSVYDPAVNVGKNAEVNQVRRAIVVHWHFIPDVPDQIFVETLSGEVIDIGVESDECFETLQPPFIPQK